MAKQLHAKSGGSQEEDDAFTLDWELDRAISWLTYQLQSLKVQRFTQEARLKKAQERIQALAAQDEVNRLREGEAAAQLCRGLSLHRSAVQRAQQFQENLNSALINALSTRPPQRTFQPYDQEAMYSSVEQLFETQKKELRDKLGEACAEYNRLGQRLILQRQIRARLSSKLNANAERQKEELLLARHMERAAALRQERAFLAHAGKELGRSLGRLRLAYKGTVASEPVVRLARYMGVLE